MKLKATSIILTAILAIGVVRAAYAQSSSPPTVGVSMNSSSSQLTPATINISASGTVITGATSKSTKVYKLVLSVATTTTVQFGDTASNNLSGPIEVTAGTPLVLPFDTQPWFTTALSAGLVITLGSGVNCSGTIYYGQS